MNLSYDVVEYIKENFPEWVFPNNYFGKWRYHNWECDTELGIWTIHFGKFKLQSVKRYEKDISQIDSFYFKGLKFYDGYSSAEDIIITDKISLDITFSFIRDMIKNEQLIKKTIIESRELIKEFNDVKIYRDKKLKEILD